MVTEAVSVLVPDAADAAIIADAAQPGPTAAEILVETAVAANLSGNGLGGIFGCPSCHETTPVLIEYLKLFLPYFPLHIQNLIQMYLKITEFLHTFQMIQNMMNHMEEYQELFKMFETSAASNPLQNMAPFMNSNFSMPDFKSMQNIMEGSDLVDEFTYMEESSGTDRYGS